jgi:hypothetical protein
MRRRSLGVTAVAIAMCLLVPTVAGSATPKAGKFTGKTATSEKKIVINVKDNQKAATVKYCGYSMGTTIKDSGKFTAKHSGPGGVYVGVKGEFVSRRKAKGTITTDFLCNTEGEDYTVRHV